MASGAVRAISSNLPCGEQGIAIDTPTLDAIHRDFLEYYEANISVGTRLYPGALALLDRFAAGGWSVAVCTNKPERMSRLLLRDLGIADRFAAICGGDSFATGSPIRRTCSIRSPPRPACRTNR